MRPTICIPTYNRGSLAVKCLATMRETLTGVDYFVLDNASTEDRDGYYEMAQDPDLRYVRLPANTGIDGAFSACLEHNAGVVIFISDEDVIPPEGLEALKSVDWDKVAVARGAIGGDKCAATPSSDEYMTCGYEAVKGYSFQHSIMSGAAYNLDKLAPVLPMYHENLWQHLEYMIFYLDLLACVTGDAQTFELPTAVAGAPADNAEPDLVKMCQHRPYSFGARIDQLIAARNGLLSVVGLPGVTDGVVLMGFVKAAFWAFHCVGLVNGRYYERGGLERLHALSALRETAYGLIAGTQGFERYADDLYRQIDDMYEAML